MELPPVPATPQPTPTRARRLLGLLPAALMVLAVVAVYLPVDVLTGERALLGFDHVGLHEPRLRYAREGLLAGEGLRAWHTRELLGAPFAANLQSFPWIPSRLPLLALDPGSAYAPAVALSAVLAATFMSLFLRARGLSRASAAIGGFTFACAGFFAGRVLQGHLPLLEAYPALPLLLWLIERLLAPGARPARALLALGGCATCVALAGHPQVPAYALTVSAAYALVRAPGAAGARAVAAMAAGVGVALAAWWPALLLTGRTTRLLPLPAMPGAESNDVWFPVARLSAFAVPWADGWPAFVARQPRLPFTMPPNEFVFWDTICYVGLAPLLALLALGVGWLARRRLPDRGTCALLALGALALLFALPWTRGLSELLPGTLLRSPARQLYVTTFSLSFALALALDAVERALSPRGRVAAAAVVIGCAILHGWDLAAHARAFVVSVPAGGWRLPALEEPARAEVGERRVAVDLMLPIGVYRRIDDVGFFDSLPLGAPYLALCALDGRPPYPVQQLDGSTLSARALAWLGVRFVVTNRPRDDLRPRAAVGRVRLLEVPDPAPRATFHPSATVAYVDDEEALARLRDGAPWSGLRLPPAARPAAGPVDARPGAVRYERPESDRIVVAVSAEAPGVVRVLESWDPGWSATVDGASAPTLRADTFALAVAVPAGTHTVELVYRTPGRATGLALGGLSAVALLLLARRSAAAGA